MSPLAERVVHLARERRVTVATAESCTGGLIAAALTDVPGASEVFGFGLVTYADEAKSALLGVPAAVIAVHGAVSAEVAGAMAEGAARLAGAEATVAVTGIAGPGGGSAQKPVGLVWFGLYARGAVRTERRVFAGLDRDGVRQASVEAALILLTEALSA